MHRRSLGVQLAVAILVFATTLGPAYANWADPALDNNGGPPTPPRAGQPLPGGRFTDSGVIPFGDAAAAAPEQSGDLGSVVVAMAPTPDGGGYWMAAADGEVRAFGDAPPLAAATSQPAAPQGTPGVHAPIIGMAATPDGGGYWLADLNGAVWPFGDAASWGSLAGRPLKAPIVQVVATPTGNGYWEVGADGSVYAFGGAHQLGSLGGHHLYAPVVGMAASPTGLGYWEVTADGGVFTFGDAHFAGSLSGHHLDGSIVGIAPTHDGRGYWLAGDNGSVFNLGDAHFYGSNVAEVPAPPIAAVHASPDGRGYWLLDVQTVATDFSRPTARTGSNMAAGVVSAAASQLGGNPIPGYYCNAYGPCEEWCALFATWAWGKAGIPIPSLAFTGDIYDWAAAHTGVLGRQATPKPGDLVLYGTGNSSTDTSVHVSVVAQVWPDGALVTIDGDAGPGPPGSNNVIINGPFLPSFSARYNGMPIYAYAQASR